MLALRDRRVRGIEKKQRGALPPKTGRFLYDFVQGPYNDQELFLCLFTAVDKAFLYTPPLFGFTEPVFPGYIRIFHDLWFDARVTNGANVLLRARSVAYRAMANNSCPPILGYWLLALTQGTPAELIGYEEFDQPQDMSQKDATLSLDVQVRSYFYTTS